MAKKIARNGRLEDLPNVGPRLAADLRRIGIRSPAQLRGNDGLKLYQKLCRVDGVRHDPCVIDCFLSIVDYMNGRPARPWWKFTAARKKTLGPAQQRRTKAVRTRR